MHALKNRLSEATPLLAPGVYDALSAAMAEEAGFEAAYLSGASIAYTRLGRPDIGLVSMTEVADVLARIRERVALPVIVDADTGFGNAMNVQRTVRVFERAGASVIQLEDQTFPKRCGHLRDKTLIPAGEMAGKIRAAVDARDTALIMARTDAIAVEGLGAALDRAELYLQAGADILFVEAPEDRSQLQAITARFAARVPLLANMVEGGKTPLASVAELGALGYRIVIFPGGLVRALAWAAQEYFASLKAHGTTAPFRNRMFDFKGLNAMLGTDAILHAARAYDDVKTEAKP
ncbi:isocitrate lyase/PEP mutase family protein [Limobrevibacterium gyesilva]|uniref:Isocitrate lyase/phosphoenolpyruvate mutase family protein n=1 Tax=Limobrevibacterium gyesilva TaxID=2991712 RepID=A0AA41YLT7_9PROT|nr:isocitrate lyase/phosphoenolpyruvate mutase family protein [Limobrevibacterium gyesilva]MCW3476226.1 isocitrate lyase/phosphoenolpyruvate mutase family protein [Limobrevibacterium gyesilva]